MDASRIQIANINITAANTDAPWKIPEGVVKFTMQCRTSVDVRIATEAGKAAASEKPHFTLKAGTSWDEHDLDISSGQILFFAAASAVVVEVFIFLGAAKDRGVK